MGLVWETVNARVGDYIAVKTDVLPGSPFLTPQSDHAGLNRDFALLFQELERLRFLNLV